MSDYIPVIGLEIHVELKTVSKMFCQCSGDYFGKKPNTNTCPVCLGLPGALPVPNKKAIEWTALMGKALGCTIAHESKFDRKHYFYPDLPKGYQISQYGEPIAVRGKLATRNSQLVTHTFGITRVHLEEDTGKLIHAGSDTLVDFNRSGVPLVEIVTEPDFDNSDDVKIFLEELHTIIRYLGISDADMEKGTMRIEPNISVRKTLNSKLETLNKSQLPKYKVEVKNINSFNFVKKAIDYEVTRQTEILERGETPMQETRGWDDKKALTYSQRSKEEAHDYRYFPEPDIPPLIFDQKYIDSIKVPELPGQKIEKYINNVGLKYSDAFVITRDKKLSEYFESVILNIKNKKLNIQIKNQKLEQLIANIIINKKLSTNLLVDEFAEKAIEMMKPKETNMDELNTIVIQIIASNPKVVEDYKKGKTNAIMFLVGQVMREMKGKADARVVKQELVKKLT